MKTHGDQRDPFMVKQLEVMKQERNKARKECDKYWQEINEVATHLGCYGHSRAIINTIEKYKKSHYELEEFKRSNKMRFLTRRCYAYLVNRFAW